SVAAPESESWNGPMRTTSPTSIVASRVIAPFTLTGGTPGSTVSWQPLSEISIRPCFAATAESGRTRSASTPLPKTTVPGCQRNGRRRPSRVSTIEPSKGVPRSRGWAGPRGPGSPVGRARHSAAPRPDRLPSRQRGILPSREVADRAPEVEVEDAAVEARPRERELRLPQRVLRRQHVEVDGEPEREGVVGAVERLGGGGDRVLEGGDPAAARVEVLPGGRDVVQDEAAQRRFVQRRLPQERPGDAHLRLDPPRGEDREVGAEQRVPAARVGVALAE